jgi:hypothetical protein
MCETLPHRYIVFKLDDVAVELTNPFGYYKSDLPICLLNDQLAKECVEALTMYLVHIGQAPSLPRVPQTLIDNMADRQGLPNPKDG